MLVWVPLPLIWVELHSLSLEKTVIYPLSLRALHQTNVHDGDSRRNPQKPVRSPQKPARNHQNYKNQRGPTTSSLLELLNQGQWPSGSNESWETNVVKEFYQKLLIYEHSWGNEWFRSEFLWFKNPGVNPKVGGHGLNSKTWKTLIGRSANLNGIMSENWSKWFMILNGRLDPSH